MLTNDNTDFDPVSRFEDPVLEFDFSAFQIGVAEYKEGPTGCTVFIFPEGATTAIDIRGGTPGTIGNHPWNHAVCFAGGSFYGLEAATGVAAELFAMAEYSCDFNEVARVSGAVIYDYASRDNRIYADKRLGRAAVKSARSGVFPIGPRGAGCSAMVGKGMDFQQGEPSGQGGAFRQLGHTKISAFTVVSAIGAIVDRQGQVVMGHLNRKTDKRKHLFEDLEERFFNPEAVSIHQGNTTLTVLITNQKFDLIYLNQLARQVHSSMARAIQPFHTVYDGDVFYAITTNEVENQNLNKVTFGVMASEVVWDAVLSIVDAT
jgi:L-aminopeptidase/D-esterase-like protein